MDARVTISELKKLVYKMVDDRDWQQFHTLKNLAINLSVESNELLEHFTWMQNDWRDCSETKRQEIADEVADVMLTILLFCRQSDIDLSEALVNKLKKIDIKYPADQVRGSSKKYTEYKDAHK